MIKRLGSSTKGIKATFYAIGHNIEQYPNEAKYIVKNGNEIGNHSYSHQRLFPKSLSFIDFETQKTNQTAINPCQYVHLDWETFDQMSFCS